MKLKPKAPEIVGGTLRLPKIDGATQRARAFIGTTTKQKKGEQ